LTGLYVGALGGQMIDQLVLLNDPTQAFGTTALAVSVLVAARGLATNYAALHGFDRPSRGGNGPGHRLRQAASRAIARLRRLASSAPW
jgi:hypothetical protein